MVNIAGLVVSIIGIYNMVCTDSYDPDHHKFLHRGSHSGNADHLVRILGLPCWIRVDKGPEFTSSKFCLWCGERNIEIQYIQLGKPMQNGYIERFNRLYREAVLDAYLFFDLDQAKCKLPLYLIQLGLEFSNFIGEAKVIF